MCQPVREEMTAFEAELSTCTPIEHSTVTKLQGLWRGYKARKHFDVKEYQMDQISKIESLIGPFIYGQPPKEIVGVPT